ncbi:hypothetical protein BRADI_3g30463v3 [Brachypodium distachyon]|uniref:Inositol polyphosphate-related phosphatase domain-containing protein n=1 Tax=Brachypodium distachyon TaxID=15368 RepID=A0A0Q3FCI1_BRADI|nr:hypothetical protein BRADI_3g30463v3 [Brachypodium distachyon]
MEFLEFLHTRFKNSYASKFRGEHLHVHYCFMWISNPFMFGLWIERCDCILWYGDGLISYFTFVESLSFSDHTPVYSIFMAEVEIVHQRKRNMGYFSSRIEVEELLPHSES